MLVKAALLLDGTGRPAVHQAAVRISGERITAVGQASDFGQTEDDEVLDLGPACLLPGLIDMHGHGRLNHLEEAPAEQVHDPESSYLQHATRNLQVDLHSGVTTVRCNGDRDLLDVRLRQQIAEQQLEGPRLLVAGRGIKSPTCRGGMVATVLVDGAPAIRAAVADNARQGVDHIKIFASGGLGPRETATQASWSADEVRAAVEAAHAAGLPIVAHCHGGPSARPLIEAGVDTIEHGSFLARSELEAMADRGTYLDMTLGILLSPRSVANQHLRQSLGDDAFGRLVDEVLGTMRQAVELGVPITLGTDTMHGMLAFEAVSLAALGVPNEGVIETLTGRAATALGRRDLFGTLEEGRIADLLAVAGDPRQDLRQLEQPRLVVQRGQVVHREGAL